MATILELLNTGALHMENINIPLVWLFSESKKYAYTLITITRVGGVGLLKVLELILESPEFTGSEIRHGAKCLQYWPCRKGRRDVTTLETFWYD